MLPATAKYNLDWWITHVISTSTGINWPVTSLKRAWWPIICMVFFEAVLSREHSGKVSKKFIGNFNFWGITLTNENSWIALSDASSFLFKDVRAHCYCASLVRTLFIGHARAESFSSARTDSKTQQNIERMKNKTQTAVINILNLHIMTWRFVCTLHTFSKVTVEI